MVHSPGWSLCTGSIVRRIRTEYASSMARFTWRRLSASLRSLFHLRRNSNARLPEPRSPGLSRHRQSSVLEPGPLFPENDTSVPEPQARYEPARYSGQRQAPPFGTPSDRHWMLPSQISTQQKSAYSPLHTVDHNVASRSVHVASPRRFEVSAFEWSSSEEDDADSSEDDSGYGTD